MAESSETSPSGEQPGDDARTVPNVAASLASAGRWVGQRGEGGRWEDLLSEFMAAILVWAGIGWLVDRWLDTAPWFLIAGALLGNSLGIYLMWLRSDPDRAASARAAADRRRGGDTVAEDRGRAE